MEYYGRQRKPREKGNMSEPDPLADPLARCRVIAEDMATRYPQRTMTITDVQMIVRDLFPEIREEFTIMLISGMLHGSLAQQGWDIID